MPISTRYEWCIPSTSCANNYGNGGQGSKVVTNPPGATNNEFDPYQVNQCSGSDKVTSTCPFTDHAIDRRLLGNQIISLNYRNYAGECIATDYSENLNIGPCPNINGGNGGSNFWVLTDCSGGAYQWESVYWDNHYDQYDEPILPSGNSQQLYLIGGSGPLNGTCLNLYSY